MKPVDFKESNISLGPPQGMDESQVLTVRAYAGEVKQGDKDGAPFGVTCWKPTENELEELQNGACVYLTCLGHVPPHYLSTSFEIAGNPR